MVDKTIAIWQHSLKVTQEEMPGSTWTLVKCGDTGEEAVAKDCCNRGNIMRDKASASSGSICIRFSLCSILSCCFSASSWCFILSTASLKTDYECSIVFNTLGFFLIIIIIPMIYF